MIAVWSYWSPPASPHHAARWASPFHHLLSWALSVSLARRWFSSTSLITDSEGARLLGALDLPFGEITCVLDQVPSTLRRWWALGKLYAYRAQTTPFVHLDSDVYLWSPLPERVTSAQLLAQNPERFPFYATYYAPAELIRTVRRANGWVPEELQWYTTCEANEACCCGIFGGNRLDFINDYSDCAIALVERNQQAWASLSDEVDYNVVVEQYLLSAFYYSQCRSNQYSDVELAYLFTTESDAYDRRTASAAGFTHVMGDAKYSPAVLARLEARVQHEFPRCYELARAVAARLPSAPGAF